MFSLRNHNFKNVGIPENDIKTFILCHKTLHITVLCQNLIKISWNFVSGFFPDFPDPVFSRKKRVRGLAGGQFFVHLLANIYILSFIDKLGLGHDGADAKSKENYIYVVVQYLLNAP